MAEKTNPLSAVTLKYRRSSTLTKIVVLTAIVLSIAALGTLRLVHIGIQNEIQDLKKEAADFEHANSELDQKIQDPDSVQSVKDIAKEELGLVDPDTILIDPR